MLTAIDCERLLVERLCLKYRTDRHCGVAGDRYPLRFPLHLRGAEMLSFDMQNSKEVCTSTLVVLVDETEEDLLHDLQRSLWEYDDVEVVTKELEPQPSAG